MIIIVDTDSPPNLADQLSERFNGKLVRISDKINMRSEEDAIDRIADLYQDYDPTGRVLIVENAEVKADKLKYRLDMIRYIALRAGAVYWKDDRLQNNDAAVMRLRRINANGLGCPEPEYVVVATGASIGRWRALPMSHKNHGSRIFWETVRDFKNVYVMSRDMEELRLLLAVPNPPKVIALGLIGSNFLLRESIKHEKVEHPSFVIKYRPLEMPEWKQTFLKSIGR